MRFGKKGKLSPRYIGPFEMLACVGKVAQRLALPSSMSGIHDVFHVSMLKKYIADSSHVLQQETVEVSPQVTYVEYPIQITEKKKN